ncbi:MAG: hypothetical protein WC456_00805 [Patescibacteria group bacterium]
MLKQIKNPILLAAFCLAAVLAMAKDVQAVSYIHGAAWWGDETQYVYMDCLDDVTGDQLDAPGNLTVPPGFRFYSVPCTNLVHHVSIDDNGNFAGEAWNYSKGLITFAATSTPPDNYAFNANCLNTCNLSNSCSACYNETTQRVYGWARVLGDGTWIKLDSAASATRTPTAIQSWNLSNPVFPGHGIQPGDFVGSATTTSDALSFNCESEWNGTDFGTCATRNYKAYVSNLEIGHLSAPHWSYSDACDFGARKAVLKWLLSSGTQTAYRIIINTANSTSSPVFDSGKQVTADTRQLTCPSALCVNALDSSLWTPAYGTNYYWWIQLWDEQDLPTTWYQFGVIDGHGGNLDEQTDGNPDGDNRTFTTYAHEFPNPFFTWEPAEVLVGTSTLFISNYASGDPLPRSCYGDCTYLWTTSDIKNIISDPFGATTSINFFRRSTNTVVTLRVTDANNYYCTKSSTLTINYGLPIWREVKAEEY